MSDSYCCFTVLPCVCTAHPSGDQIVLIRLIRTHLAGDLALMDNNTIRSEREIISSSSADTSRTPAPAFFAFSSVLRISSMAPISTPLVGWDATRSLLPRDTSRATTTFCALPPDKEDVGKTIIRRAYIKLFYHFFCIGILS